MAPDNNSFGNNTQSSGGASNTENSPTKIKYTMLLRFQILIKLL